MRRQKRKPGRRVDGVEIARGLLGGQRRQETLEYPAEEGEKKAQKEDSDANAISS